MTVVETLVALAMMPVEQVVTVSSTTNNIKKKKKATEATIIWQQ